MTSKTRLFPRFNEARSFAFGSLSTSALAATLLVAAGLIGADYATGGTFFTTVAPTADEIEQANREKQFAPFPEPSEQVVHATAGTFCASDSAGSDQTTKAAANDHC